MVGKLRGGDDGVGATLYGTISTLDDLPCLYPSDIQDGAERLNDFRKKEGQLRIIMDGVGELLVEDA
jgi:hypothetical protein